MAVGIVYRHVAAFQTVNLRLIGKLRDVLKSIEG